MMDRRNFIAFLAAPLVLQNLKNSRRKNTDTVATTQYIFNQAMKRVKSEKWDTLPIGQLMGNIGVLFVGTPYVGGTLEGDGPEVCRIDLTGLDCVTFFENVLDMARIAKRNTYGLNDLSNEVTFTRYRGGKLDGYLSRLHYTADWIHDNVEKSVVRDVTQEAGGVPFPINVGFMSANPKYYKPLVADSTLVPQVALIENRINAAQHYYIPQNKIENSEGAFQTGDIVAIATSKSGLDYAHTGMIYRTTDGVAHFLHASVNKKKVILDVSISDYVKSVKSHTGITVVRPLEVKTS